MNGRMRWWACAAVALAALSGGCGSESREAREIEVPVVVDPAASDPVETDEGWKVVVEALWMSLRDLAFTTEGRMHAARSAPGGRLIDWVVPAARAHPGHRAGGDVIGELNGTWTVDWLDSGRRALGDATMLEGEYNGANFGFGEIDPDAAGEPPESAVGSAIYLRGTAEKGDRRVAFEAAIEQPEDRRVIGAEMSYEVSGETGDRLVLRAAPEEPEEGDTWFDGIDFAGLEDDRDDGPARIAEGESAYNRLQKAFRRHEHYRIEARAVDE